MVTVFAVATVASSVVIAAGLYRKAAARAESELLERVTLESGVAAQADALLIGPPSPLAAHPGLTFAINGRTVTVEVSAPQGKYDLNGDSAESIGQGLSVYGFEPALRDRISGLVAAGQAAGGAARFESLLDLAAALELSQTQEDCVRRWLTVGRWPGPMDDTGVGNAGKHAATRRFSPGDQADIRAVVEQRGGGRRVLWARLRHTGDAAEPWGVHDWRFLQPGGATAATSACP